MKKIYTILLGILFISGNFNAKAQSFSVQYDTAFYNWPGGTSSQNVLNGIINPTSVPTDSVTVQWKVIATDFPADWMTYMSSPITGVCDNNLCYNGTALWPSSLLVTSRKYGMGTGDFHMQINLSNSSNGSHWMTVRMYNQAIPTDSVTTTFVINKIPAAVQPITKPVSDVSIYPNPATNELNLIYDASTDVRTIAVYSIIGKVMAVYKVSGHTGANLNLENIPAGIYFVRLMNSRGDITATKRFTKQ